MRSIIFVILGIMLSVSILSLSNTPFAATFYEVAILNGRIIDPESNLDSVHNIGIIQPVINNCA